MRHFANVKQQVAMANNVADVQRILHDPAIVGERICHSVLQHILDGDSCDDKKASVMNATTVSESSDELRLQRFLRWLHVNDVQLRGCELRRCWTDMHSGLGVYASHDSAQGVLMVTPLILAITPMTVLQDPLLGPHYCQLFEEGDVDDRLVIMLFLVIEHARGQASFWAPYLDMLPSRFGTPLCFSDEELLELKGTTLFHATQQQQKSLRALFGDKVKVLAESFLSTVDCDRREVNFQDFIWANCIFWTRALNIPCPHSFVFPAQLPVLPARRALQTADEPVNPPRVAEVESAPLKFGVTYLDTTRHTELLAVDLEGRTNTSYNNAEDLINGLAPDIVEPICTEGLKISTEDTKCVSKMRNTEGSIGDVRRVTRGIGGEQLEGHSELPPDGPVEGHHGVEEAGAEAAQKTSSVWVEGLVPGIDFCNHVLAPLDTTVENHSDHKAVALWEVDGPEGSNTGVPNSMYLVTGPDVCLDAGSEVFINYGNKGNEELLYLYGFVTDLNPDDYLMVYFPKEALEESACSDTKSQLLAELKLPLRWLLPSSELKRGFYGENKSDVSALSEAKVETQKSLVTSHSWSGLRKAPPNLEHLVFPEDLLTALRIVAMEEDEVYQVAAMLEEISDPAGGRVPSDADIRAAVWEVCGNAGGLQLLVDLLTSKMMEIEEGTGTEDVDAELLAKDKKARLQPKEVQQLDWSQTAPTDKNLLSKNKRACVIYRKGQKRLSRLFLQEAEQALDKCVD